MMSVSIRNSGTLILLHICLFDDQYFIWLKKWRADFYTKLTD